MRKILFALVIAFSIATTSNAQKIKIGVNAGATYSGFSGMSNTFIDYNYWFGFMAGGSFEYYLNDNVSLRANLSFERKSNRAKSEYSLRESYDEPEHIYDQTFTNHYDYLTLPVMAKVDFGRKNLFFVSGGIFVGYLLQSELRSQSEDQTNYDPIDEPFDESPINTTGFNKRLDYGISIGIGKRFKMSDKNELVLEIRDNLGLANTNDATSTKIKTNSVNLILGWQFTL